MARRARQPSTKGSSQRSQRAPTSTDTPAASTSPTRGARPARGARRSRATAEPPLVQWEEADPQVQVFDWRGRANEWGLRPVGAEDEPVDGDAPLDGDDDSDGDRDRDGDGHDR